MSDSILLAIAPDDRLVQHLRWHLQDHEDGESRLTVVRTIDAACTLLETAAARPRLIAVHWDGGGRYDGLNRLLWTTTALARPIPVLVVTDWYRVGQATRLFRMGVAEYIGRNLHQRQLGRILDAHLRRGPIRRPEPDATAGERRQPFDVRPRPTPAVTARVG